MKVIQTKQRRWQRLSDTQKIRYLLKDKLSAHIFYVKNTVPPIIMTFMEYADGTFVFACNCEPESFPLQLTLYTTLNKHVEIDFTVMSSDGGRFVMSADQLRIGMDTRSTKRVAVDEEIVVADNFQIGKRIDPDTIRKTSLAYQIIFNEIEEDLQAIYPNSQVLDVHATDLPDEIRLLKNQTGYMHVEDTHDPESYKPSADGMLNYHAYLTEKNQLEETVRRYGQKKIRSFFLRPVITEEGSLTPIAYLYAHSSEAGAGFSPEVFDEAARKLIKRIEDANFVYIRGRQRVINVSENGVALEIDHPELLKYLPGREWITFDLIFKKQSPIRFRGSFCHIADFEGTYVAGINFEGTGHSDHIRTSVERFKTLLKIASGEKKK